MKGSSTRRKLGQHFLMNARVITDILDALGAAPGETVVEVGPGRGALTLPLLARGVRVLALEMDERLASHFPSRPELSVRHADAREADVAALVAELEPKVPLPISLVGNLPYESATPMLRRFVRQPTVFRKIIAMIQKEVAQRLVAPPGGEAYGYLTVDVGAHARVRTLFDVGRFSFAPPPQVISTVVELIPVPAAEGTEEAIAVASAGFSARRKTLLNALTPRYGREKAEAAVVAAGLPLTTRAETLPFETFQKLAGLLR